MAVEKGGDERLASQAIFYHTTAALNAGAITAPQAIESAAATCDLKREQIGPRSCAEWNL